MIVIYNVDENVRTAGPHKYLLTINKNVVVEFTHDREKPLHECLLQAAIAVEEKVKPKNGLRKPLLEPRYDDVYFEGMKWLDSL